MCSDYVLFKRGLYGTFLNKLYFIYIHIFIYKSFVCCMTLIISTVGRCNHWFAQIDKLIVQVPRIVKEPGMFSHFKVLPISCFQIWDWAQCQSRLFLSIELTWMWQRDLSDEWKETWQIYVYITKFKMWYPLDALATRSEERRVGKEC